MTHVVLAYRRRNIPLAVITAGEPMEAIDIDGYKIPYGIPDNYIVKEWDSRVSSEVRSALPVVYKINGVLDKFAVYHGFTRRETRNAWLKAYSRKIGYHEKRLKDQQDWEQRKAESTRPARYTHAEKVAYNRMREREIAQTGRAREHPAPRPKMSEHDRKHIGRIVMVIRPKEKAAKDRARDKPQPSERETAIMESFEYAQEQRTLQAQKDADATKAAQTSTDAVDYAHYGHKRELRIGQTIPAPMTFFSRHGKVMYRDERGVYLAVANARDAKALKGEQMRRVSAARMLDVLRQPLVKALQAMYEEVLSVFRIGGGNRLQSLEITETEPFGQIMAELAGQNIQGSAIAPKQGAALPVRLVVQVETSMGVANLVYKVAPSLTLQDVANLVAVEGWVRTPTWAFLQQNDPSPHPLPMGTPLDVLSIVAPTGLPQVFVRLVDPQPYEGEEGESFTGVRRDIQVKDTWNNPPAPPTAGPAFRGDAAGDGPGRGGKGGKKGAKTNPQSRGPSTSKSLEATAKRLESLLLSAGPLKGKGMYTSGSVYTGHGKFKIPKVVKQAATAGLKAAAREGASAMMKGSGLYSGRGEYRSTPDTITNELIDGAGEVRSIPTTFSTRSDESAILTVHGREFMTDLLGPTTAFNVQTYDINPGMATFLNKLAQVAANFKMYKMTKLIVLYKSTTSDIGASTTGQVGMVIIASTPNCNDADFVGKRDMLDFKGAVSAKTTDNLVHGFECDREKGAAGWRYVRTLPVLTNEDQKTYDVGTIAVAVSNCPAAFSNLMIGELWLEYEFELKDFFLNSSLGNVIPRDFYTSPVQGATATGANLFGGANAKLLKDQQNSIGCRVALGPTGGTFTLPATFEGAVHTTVVINCPNPNTGANLNAASVALTGSIVPFNNQYSGSGSLVNGVGTSSLSVGAFGVIVVEGDWYVAPAASGLNNSFTWTGSVGCTSIVSTSVTITQINSQGMNNTLQPPPLAVVGTNVPISGASI